MLVDQDMAIRANHEGFAVPFCHDPLPGEASRIKHRQAFDLMGLNPDTFTPT